MRDSLINIADDFQAQLLAHEKTGHLRNERPGTFLAITPSI